jgi:undecaprenyl-diphosphatase
MWYIYSILDVFLTLFLYLVFMNIFYTFHETINKPLYLLLNWLSHNSIIEEIVYIFADAPIFILPIFLLWCWIFFNYKKNILWKNTLLFILYSIIFAIVINLIIQRFVLLERPEESLKNAGKLILQHIPDRSFPSDHATVASAFFFSLLLFWFSRWAFIFLPFAGIMLFSRIIWWIHWPFDVCFWIIVWYISSFTIYKNQEFIIFKKMNTLIIKIISYFKL